MRNSEIASVLTPIKEKPPLSLENIRELMAADTQQFEQLKDEHPSFQALALDCQGALVRWDNGRRDGVFAYILQRAVIAADRDDFEQSRYLSDAAEFIVDQGILSENSRSQNEINRLFTNANHVKNMPLAFFYPQIVEPQDDFSHQLISTAIIHATLKLVPQENLKTIKELLNLTNIPDLDIVPFIQKYYERDLRHILQPETRHLNNHLVSLSKKEPSDITDEDITTLFHYEFLSSVELKEPLEQQKLYYTATEQAEQGNYTFLSIALAALLVRAGQSAVYMNQFRNCFVSLISRPLMQNAQPQDWQELESQGRSYLQSAGDQKDPERKAYYLLVSAAWIVNLERFGRKEPVPEKIELVEGIFNRMMDDYFQEVDTNEGER